MSATPATTRPRRTCAELGVCQNRPTRCLLCIDDPAPWTPDEVTCTPFERIGYWITLTVVCCITAGTAVGSACFIYGRWFA